MSQGAGSNARVFVSQRSSVDNDSTCQLRLLGRLHEFMRIKCLPLMGGFLCAGHLTCIISFNPYTISMRGANTVLIFLLSKLTSREVKSLAQGQRYMAVGGGGEGVECWGWNP